MGGQCVRSRLVSEFQVDVKFRNDTRELKIRVKFSIKLLDVPW